MPTSAPSSEMIICYDMHGSLTIYAEILPNGIERKGKTETTKEGNLWVHQKVCLTTLLSLKVI